MQLRHKYICLHSSLHLSSLIYIPLTENCVWQTIQLPKISFPVVSEIVFSLTDFESIFYVIGCFNFVRRCQFLFIIKFSVMIGAVYLLLLAVESQCLFLKFPPGVMKVRKHLVNWCDWAYYCCLGSSRVITVLIHRCIPKIPASEPAWKLTDLASPSTWESGHRVCACITVVVLMHDAVEWMTR